MKDIPYSSHSNRLDSVTSQEHCQLGLEDRLLMQIWTGRGQILDSCAEVCVCVIFHLCMLICKYPCLYFAVLSVDGSLVLQRPCALLVPISDFLAPQSFRNDGSSDGQGTMELTVKHLLRSKSGIMLKDNHGCMWLNVTFRVSLPLLPQCPCGVFLLLCTVCIFTCFHPTSGELVKDSCLFIF